MNPTLNRFGLSSHQPPLPTVDEQIAAFLDGRSHGEGLLHALYDHILDEPIPAKMRALLRNH